MSTAKRLHALMQQTKRLLLQKKPQPKMLRLALILPVAALMLSACKTGPDAEPKEPRQVFCTVYKPVCFGANDLVSVDAEAMNIQNNELWFHACNGGVSVCQPGL